MAQSFTHPRFRSLTSMDVVSFDCDATLTQIEGIDWIAQLVGHGSAVEAMTRIAMQETGINGSLYKDRLELIKPDESHLNQLVMAYQKSVTADAQAVIQCLLELEKTVCVLSAGLTQAVVPFAESLGVNPLYAHAVPLIFCDAGKYVGYEEGSDFIRMDGKGDWLNANFPDKSCAHIGDGLNDVSVKEAGVRLVGFGGGQHHARVAQHCSEYIVANSLAPFLSLILTAQEVECLSRESQAVVARGDQIILEKGVLFESKPGRGVC